MTETAPVSLMCGRNTPLERRGSVGQLLRGTRARIVDLGTGQDLGPNQRGELLIKGPLVSDPAVTYAALIKMLFIF